MPVALRMFYGFIAVLITAAVLAATASFYWTFAADPIQAFFYVSIACISAAMKLTILTAARYGKGQTGFVAICWLLFFSAVAFDAFGVAGFYGMTRGGKETEAANIAATRSEQKAEVARLRGLADDYKGAKTVAEIQPEIDRTAAKAGNCKYDAASKLCQQLSQLDADKARAEERDKRESNWKTAADKLAALPRATGPPDAQADMFKSWLGESAGPFARLAFTALTLILTELGAPAAAYAALGGAGTAPARRAAPPVPSAETPASARARRPRRVRLAEPETLMDMLAAVARGERREPGVTGEGGKRISGSMRAFGKAFGTSASTMQRQLEQLEAAGRVRLDTGSGGTIIFLT